MTRNAWHRLPGPGGLTSHVFVDVLGRRWLVRHCGHPTAHRPFSAYTHDGEPVPQPITGKAWETSTAAKAHLEELAREDVARLFDEAAARVLAGDSIVVVRP